MLYLFQMDFNFYNDPQIRKKEMEVGDSDVRHSTACCLFDS